MTRETQAAGARPQAAWLTIMPGLALAAAIALSTQYFSDWLGASLFNLSKSPVSPVMLAILTGLLIRNTVGIDARLEQGVAVASGSVLRIGLALVGLRLSIIGLGKLGLEALPIVVGCMLTAWLVLPRLARAMHLKGGLITLLTVGTTICGCTAIMAVAPVIRAKAEEISYAVTLVVIIGLTGMLFYPALAHYLFGNNPLAAGIFLGTSIHDTSQVMGAALLYSGQYLSPETLEAATVTKLLRNLTLIVVVPVLAARHAGQGTDQPRGASKWMAWRRLLPGFVLAFVLMAVLRTIGDAISHGQPGFDLRIWQPGLSLAGRSSELLLTVGMAAVGLTVDLGGMRRVGWRPLVAGVLAAATVAVVCISLLYTLT